MKYYAGIGSRKTPFHILSLMTNIARDLEAIGYTLRSGGADGADKAFSHGCKNKEIYIPWKGFNGINDATSTEATKDAFLIVSSIHPAWDRCSHGAKKLHARNVHQILGSDIHDEDNYSSFVVCWTPNGQTIGGTATAIKLANQRDIPVYNLALPGDLNKLDKFIKEQNEKDNRS